MRILVMKRFAQGLFLACAFTGLSATAQAPPFPTGPITLVVPLAPGDAADIAARALGEEISRLLKTPVIVDQSPGRRRRGRRQQRRPGEEKTATPSCSRRTAR